MFFNHATDKKTNTRSDIANYWAIPPVSQWATAKNQNWKSCGIRRQCQQKHVRIRAICKLEQISHMAMAIVSCCGWEEIFKVIAQSISLASGLTLSDIIEKQLLYNISAPAVLILHLTATGDRARVVLGRLAPEILHSAFLPSGQNFLQPVQQAVVSAGAA